jgi:hypothetical protein
MRNAILIIIGVGLGFLWIALGIAIIEPYFIGTSDGPTAEAMLLQGTLLLIFAGGMRLLRK